MSHRNVIVSEEGIRTSGHGTDNQTAESGWDEIEKDGSKEPEESRFNGLEVKVERLKNDVKNLKKIKKQQEKLGKLEEKKIEILNEIEREQERERRSKHKHDRKKR